MNRVKKGDSVLVIAGKDKGKVGVVRKAAEGKVLVDGVNIVKRHVKSNPQAGIVGGIIEKEVYISASNVSLYDGQSKKLVKVGFKSEAGKKIRFDKRSGKEI